MRNGWAFRTTILLLLFLAGAMGGTNHIPSALGNEGGPTGSCDYAWTDSNAPSPVVSFSWIDIQTSGTRIISWQVNSDDGWVGPLPLGFNFSFYGTTFSEVFVGTNGYVSFGQGHSAIPFAAIPDPSPPDGFAMGFGADLNPSAASAPGWGVYYEQLTAPNRFVVAYYDILHFPSSDPVTFEIVLYENGEIWFQYLSLTGAVDVVGIEDLDGETGTSYTGALSNSLAIRFQLNGLLPAPVGVFVAPCAQTASGLPGAQVNASLNVTNVGTAGDDTFDVRFASPSGWNATFYESDGMTLLSDTNANSTPDTGVVASGNTTEIVLRIDVPPDAFATELITVTANSSVNASFSSSANIRVEVPPTIVSAVASVIPTIDGVSSPGEWADAFSVDLTAIPLNLVPGLLLAKNDFETLYVAYDATGDTTADLFDVASIAFDTDGDGLATDGREDQFVLGGLGGGLEEAHAVFNASVLAWILEDAPYDPGLPNHEGLESAWGFGPSDNSPTDHRIYEFAIPLALLGAAPGDALGFFGGSQFVPGLLDSTIGSWSTWPVWTAGPIPLSEYGTFSVGPAVPPDHDVAVTGLEVSAFVLPNTTIPVNASIRNRGVNDETAVLVNLTVDGAVQANTTLTMLANGTSTPVSFSWTVPSTEGARRVGIQVAQVPSESLTFNNERARDVTALTGPPPGRLALVSDGSELGILTPILDALGMSYDVLNGNSFSANTEDINLLRQYEAVVYYTTFGMGRAEQEVLEGYIQLGGKLLITGFDSLFFRSPLADLVRSTTTGDIRFVSGFTVSDGSHPIMNGAFGSFPTGTSLTTVVDDHDQVQADTARGARTVAELIGGGGADKIIVTELPSGGIVTYWNGQGAADWNGNPDLAIMFKNLIDWYVTGPADVVPPTLTISSPSSGDLVDVRDVFVSWVAADLGSGLDRIEVRLDGGAPAVLSPTASNHTLLGVSDGAHGITVTAFDVLGNSENATVNVTVDTTPPSLSITAPSVGGYLATSGVEVTWTAVDALSGIAGFEVSLDGASVVTLGPTATGHTFTSVAEGSHTVTITVLDLAGHTQTAAVDFTVDRTGPTISISVPADASIVNSGSLEVVFSAQDSTSGIERLEVTLDGGAPVTLPATASSHTFVGLADGAHAVEVTAVDRAGNVASATVEFSVDTSFLSPTGPFGVFPLIYIGVGVAAAALVVFLYLRKRASERSAGGEEKESP